MRSDHGDKVAGRLPVRIAVLRQMDCVQCVAEAFELADEAADVRVSGVVPQTDRGCGGTIGKVE